MNLFVTKRNGHKEPIDLDKIHRVLDWAAEKLDNVSVSQVELKSHIQFYDGIRTADIHETIIRLLLTSSPSKARTTSTWLPVWPSSTCARRPTAVQAAPPVSARRQTGGHGQIRQAPAGRLHPGGI